MGLCLHCGSVEVGEDEVRAVPTPQPTQTFIPVPHAYVLDRVRNEVQSLGMAIVAQSFGLWNAGARFFGLLEVRNGHNREDYGLVLGIRNAHDHAFSLTLGCGSHCFCCDNLAFSSEIVIKTRHTMNIMQRIPTLISRATAQLIDQRQHQDRRIDAYKATVLDDVHAHDLMIRAIRDHVICPSGIAHVMQEWDDPTYAEFQPRTVWSLFNGFTHVLKDTNPLDMPKRTMALHGLCDGVSGLAVHSTK